MDEENDMTKTMVDANPKSEKKTTKDTLLKNSIILRVAGFGFLIAGVVLMLSIRKELVSFGTNKIPYYIAFIGIILYFIGRVLPYISKLKK